jgi:two-component system chemotaxis sensor kinase CheA
MTDNSGNFSDDMAEYLQTFLDETEEQLDDLVETLLALERDPANASDLNEAFRLVHSIKGSAGMMGFDNITVLTHHLENRFERFRSGLAKLDEPTMNLVLRCIDFLRQCNDRLRAGQQLGSSTDLLAELKTLEEQAAAPRPESNSLSEQPSVAADLVEVEAAAGVPPRDFEDADLCVVVRFVAGLQLADLKAQLIVTRLAGLGEVKATEPDLDQHSESDELTEFKIWIDAQVEPERLRAAADVDGVATIEVEGSGSLPATHAITAEVPEELPEEESEDAPEEQQSLPDSVTEELAPTESSEVAPVATEAGVADEQPVPPLASAPQAAQEQASEPGDTSASRAIVEKNTSGEMRPASKEKSAKVAETMRVDIERLDKLMNLAGELVVNRARFVQISDEISPALRKATMLNRVRDFGDNLRQTINSLESSGEWSAQVQQLRNGLELLHEQTEILNNGRLCFNQINEAVDQLSRVSFNLQRGVLDTRMMPVSPLFNRFKRVVRDLSKDRGKKVNLLIHGENTELDKRMIDELGDPLVHLVRNSLDHGMESPEVRISRGKSEIGTIVLEASHSGNNVLIHVRDDGGGIDVAKIKAKLVANQILSAAVVDELSDQQALDYIWDPGFSTAQEITDISGRGVGMDVVKTRINQLNGTIDLKSVPGQGTHFTIRLPLTLAIIRSLLVRLRDVTLAMPIDDVREIVSVAEDNIITVHGKQTIDVRGEFIPLVRIDDVFQWHDIDYGYQRDDEKAQGGSANNSVEVVVLQASRRSIGLRVDELIGSQDIVIKSLSDNFLSIRGLSGASILGDGSVSLMLDVGTFIDMVTRPMLASETEEVLN